MRGCGTWDHRHQARIGVCVRIVRASAQSFGNGTVSCWSWVLVLLPRTAGGLGWWDCHAPTMAGHVRVAVVDCLHLMVNRPRPTVGSRSGPASAPLMSLGTTLRHLRRPRASLFRGRRAAVAATGSPPFRGQPPRPRGTWECHCPRVHPPPPPPRRPSTAVMTRSMRGGRVVGLCNGQCCGAMGTADVHAHIPQGTWEMGLCAREKRGDWSSAAGLPLTWWCPLQGSSSRRTLCNRMVPGMDTIVTALFWWGWVV